MPDALLECTLLAVVTLSPLIVAGLTGTKSKRRLNAWLHRRGF